MNKRSTKIRVSELLTQQIEIQLQQGKTLIQIAREVGYDGPNIIRMFASGQAKVPLDKVSALARSLNVELSLLFRLTLLQYWNDDDALEALCGCKITNNEREILIRLRELTDGRNPPLTAELDRKLTAGFSPEINLTGERPG